MSLLTSKSSLNLWQEVIKHAEERCSVALQKEIESYLVSLLMQYTNKPEVAKQVFATAYLEAMQLKAELRSVSLQHVGDQCLLFAGLFPHAAEKRRVKVRYFVDIGRSAYAAISSKTNDLYGKLSLEFVVLMDILQSIRPNSDLLPLEAYEQWEELGSKRALQILTSYTNGMPIKNYKIE